MTDLVRYPEGLRTLLRDSKQVTRVSGYETSDPLYGPAYTRITTTDTPTLITGTVIFNRAESRTFQNFLRKIRNGIDQFIMPIDSEYGPIDQVCQALPGSFNPSQQGEVFSYNVSLVIREWALPPMLEYEDSFIDIGWLIPNDFSIFDEAINWGLTGEHRATA